MESLRELIWLTSDLRPLLADLAVILAKGTFLLAVAGLLTYALRQSAAATRYLVWCTALVGLFLLPVFQLVLPSWEVAMLPAEEQVVISAYSLESAEPVGSWPDATPMPRSEAADAAAMPAAVSQNVALPRLHWSQWALLIWAVGVVVVLVRLVLAHAGARLLVRQAAFVDDEDWHVMAESAAHRLGLTQVVRLRMSDWTSVPMAIGILRPVVVLPVGADTWSERRKQEVLLHELAHIKRRDGLFQLLTNLICALYWFNPLVWMAAWQMRIERERACDDLVIVSGADASNYAETLLETARALRKAEWSTLAAVSMARGSQLEGRLLSILDPLRRRNQNRLSMALTLALVACIALPLAALQPARAQQAPPSAPQRTPRELPAPPRTPREIVPPIDIPDIDVDIPPIDIDIPEIDVDIPEIDVDIPAFHFTMPAIQIPEFDIDIPPIDIDIPEMNIDIPGTEWREDDTPVDSLTIEQIIKLRQYGVDAGFIAELRRLGYTDLTYADLIAMGRYGVDAEYIAEMQAIGFSNLTLEDYATMSRYGVDPSFVRAMREAGYSDVSRDDLVAMSRYGVDADLIAMLSRSGYDRLTSEELIKAARYGVDEDLVATLNDAGYTGLSLDDVVAMSRYGVDEDLIQALARAGYRDVSPEDLIAASRYGVDEDLVDGLRAAGYADLDLETLVKMSRYGVDAEFIQEMKDSGINASTDELLQLQRYGVDGDFVREIRGAGLENVTIEELIDLRRNGVDGEYIRSLRGNE